jgi:hypothetical protein
MYGGRVEAAGRLNDMLASLVRCYVAGALVLVLTVTDIVASNASELVSAAAA